jgi:hypothetical protein
VVGSLLTLARGNPRRPARVLEEVADIDALGDAYSAFWERARGAYDTTVDRSIEFLRWRFRDNPHVRFRTWCVREEGRVTAVVIAHCHRLGTASALYVDDVVTEPYTEEAFDEIVAGLAALDGPHGAVVLKTLSVDTPLRRVLGRRYRWQAVLLRRFGYRFFGRLLVYDPAGSLGPGPWYATAVLTEGIDTSR